MSTNQKAIEVSAEGSVLSLAFANGERLVVNISTLSVEIAHAALMHGIKQKLVDAAAMSRNPDTGRAATIDEKFEAVKEVFDRITGDNPSWNKQSREGGGGSTGGLLLRALMDLYGKPRDVMQGWLDAKSDAEKAALRKNPKIAGKILELQAQSGRASAIDTNELLAELDGNEANAGEPEATPKPAGKKSPKK